MPLVEDGDIKLSLCLESNASTCNSTHDNGQKIIKKQCDDLRTDWESMKTDLKQTYNEHEELHRRNGKSLIIRMNACVNG